MSTRPTSISARPETGVKNRPEVIRRPTVDAPERAARGRSERAPPLPLSGRRDPRQHGCRAGPQHGSRPAVRQSRESPHRRPIGRRDNGTETPALARRRVRATTCDWSNARPRIHAAGGLLAAIGNALLFANGRFGADPRSPARGRLSSYPRMGGAMRTCATYPRYPQSRSLVTDRSLRCATNRALPFHT